MRYRWSVTRSWETLPLLVNWRASPPVSEMRDWVYQPNSPLSNTRTSKQITRFVRYSRNKPLFLRWEIGLLVICSTRTSGWRSRRRSWRASGSSSSWRGKKASVRPDKSKQAMPPLLVFWRPFPPVLRDCLCFPDDKTVNKQTSRHCLCFWGLFWVGLLVF